MLVPLVHERGSHGQRPFPVQGRLTAFVAAANLSAALRVCSPMNPLTPSRMTAAAVIATLIASAPAGWPADQPQTILKSETFDRDPGWEGHNNRMTPKKASVVKQDFGYSTTHFAGKAAGEMGGAIQRATKPASYAAALTPAKTLEDRLSASGTFAMPVRGGGGVFFGFFNSQQPGGSGRPIGSLGLDFDFESHGGRLAVRLISNGNKSCGTFITPYLPGKFRPRSEEHTSELQSRLHLVCRLLLEK